MSNDDFDKKLDKAVSDYEKGFDKAAGKAEKVIGTVQRGANRMYIGCITIFANLFFAAFCLWGAYAATVSWRLQSAGELVTGVITRLEESKTRDGYCCVYSPVVEFEVNGQKYTFENENASGQADYEIGAKVLVLYDPSNPHVAQINTFSDRWLFPIMIIPAMILSSLLFNFFTIRAWRRGDDLLSRQMV
jgi:hypothetical protein